MRWKVCDSKPVGAWFCLRDGTSQNVWQPTPWANIPLCLHGEMSRLLRNKGHVAEFTLYSEGWSFTFNGKSYLTTFIHAFHCHSNHTVHTFLDVVFLNHAGHQQAKPTYSPEHILEQHSKYFFFFSLSLCLVLCASQTTRTCCSSHDCTAVPSVCPVKTWCHNSC